MLQITPKFQTGAALGAGRLKRVPEAAQLNLRKVEFWLIQMLSNQFTT
jgi:hypothetical protein